MHIQEQLSFLLCLILDGLGIDGKLYYLSILFCFGFLLSFTISVNATDSENKPLCNWIYFNILCAKDCFLGQDQALIYESKYAKNNTICQPHSMVLLSVPFLSVLHFLSTLELSFSWSSSLTSTKLAAWRTAWSVSSGTLNLRQTHKTLLFKRLTLFLLNSWCSQ